MTKFISTTALLTLCASMSFAAGSSDPTPPKETETTRDCFQKRLWDPVDERWVRFSEKVNGVWDETIEKCVRPDRAASLGSDKLYEALRELAYAERYDEAQQVIAQLPEEMNDIALTYRGFIARKTGNLEAAFTHYQAAIADNPDNLLARSYMGQAYAELGNLGAARTQLREIEARGAAHSWAATSLASAIETGQGYRF